VCRVTIRGTDPKTDYALPDDMSLPGDFTQAILKLQKGSGWIHLHQTFTEYQEQEKIQDSNDISAKKLLKCMQERPASGKQAKVEAIGRLYTENFDIIERAPPPAWRAYRRCILFSSFSTCRTRFKSLRQYTDKVHKELRRHIEAVDFSSDSALNMHGPMAAQSVQTEDACEGPLLLPMKTSGRQAPRTKLNAVQLSILENLKAPLDFVQGPPGEHRCIPAALC
jgi:hypothetical protein